MMDIKQAKVIPIFYDLETKELRMEGNGPFATNFEEHLAKCKHEEESIKRWNRIDGALINDLVKKIRDEIFDSLPVDTTAVGLDDRVRRVVELFCLHDTTKVYALSFFGLGGVGKTTLAQAFYGPHRKDYEEASFVESCAK